jgi:hypothetical protein
MEKRKTDENNNKKLSCNNRISNAWLLGALPSMQASQSSAGRRLSRGIDVSGETLHKN